MHVVLILLTMVVTATPLIASNETVILLHGLCRTNKSMEKMERFLLSKGYHTINVSYPSRQKTIETLSVETIQPLLTTDKVRNSKEVHFVTHSMGGILVRYYLRHHAIPKLGKVVMLGPPNQGSEVVNQLKNWALFKNLNGPAGQQLGTNSFTSTLGPVDFTLGIIAGKKSINWINSMMIEGQNDGKVSVEHTKVRGMTDHIILNRTHPFLMKAPDALDMTHHFLEHAAFPE